MYANDTRTSFSYEDVLANNRAIAINKELDKVNVWLKLKLLALNVEKKQGLQRNKLDFDYNYYYAY